MSSTYPQVSIPATGMRTLASSYADQEHQILIGLPDSYGDLDKTYPVLYLLDGNCYFGTTLETVRMGAAYGELPEMIIVGIGYPVQTLVETWPSRTRDYTPIDVEGWWEATFSQIPGFPEYVGSGKAKDFLHFIREELMPAIHCDYRTEPENQTIVGHSAGGTFGAWVLFHHPEVFQRYVLCSSASWSGRIDLFQYEREFAAKNSDLPASVFLSAGSLEREHADEVHRLSEAMEGRGYPSLKITTHVFEGETHISVIPAQISRGLRMVHR